MSYIKFDVAGAKELPTTTQLRQPTPQLLDLISVLQKKIRGLTYTESRNSDLVHLHLQGDKYSCMELRFEYDGESSYYAVVSRNIENKRFRTHKREHYEKQTMSFASAVKLVCKYFKPISDLDLAAFYVGSLKTEVDNIGFDLRRSVRLATERVSSDEVIVKELMSLHECGHTFISMDIPDRLKALTLATEQSAEHMQVIERGFTFINLSEDGTAAYSHISNTALEALTSGTTNGDYQYNIGRLLNKGPFETKVVEQTALSEHIVGKLSVLGMVDAGEYVTGVGMKVSEHMAFIHNYQEPV